MRHTLLPMLLASALAAEEFGIRLAGEAQPGCWSVEEIAAAVTAGARTDREKALALHRFGMAHFIHFNGPIEERGEYVTDPLKLIGVYGYALCGNNSSAMCALYNAAGLRARTRSMPGHSAPEVWFEGKWNYIDTDMFGYVPLPDGRIASVDELTRDPGLFLRQKNPPDPYYPFDEKSAMAAVFRGAAPSRNYHPYANAHMMNLGLRTGESATLYFRPKGRFLLTTIRPPELGITYRDYWVKGPVRKGSLAWCDEPPAAYGNGLIEYAPGLRSAAFRLENPAMENAVAGQGREQPDLVAGAPGRAAFVVLEMSTPWVIAGLQNDPTDFDDDTDGAVMSGRFWRHGAADETRIFVSADGGRTWKKAWENAGPFLGAVPFRVDLTRHVKGRYAYAVKLEWVDRTGARRVGPESLRLHTWVAVSPMALPRLTTGRNSFHFSAGRRRTVYHESRWDRGEPLAGERIRNLVRRGSPPYLRPERPETPGVLEFASGAEGALEEVRVSLLARADAPGQPVRAVLSLSGGGGDAWKDLETFESHPDHDTNHMWFNHVIRGLSAEASRLRLRLAITGGGFEKVIANSALRAGPRAPGALRVTHAWSENGQMRTIARVFGPGESPATYEVEAAPDIRNAWLRLEALPEPGGPEK